MGSCEFFTTNRGATTKSYDLSVSSTFFHRCFLFSQSCSYALGSSTETKKKFHEGETVRFELDMDEAGGVCRGWVNGEEQGILFKDLRSHGTIYPCAQFYSSSRACKITKVLIYPSSSSSAGGASAAGAAASGSAAVSDGEPSSTWLASLKYNNDETSLAPGVELSIGNQLTSVPIHDPASVAAAAGAGAGADGQAAQQQGSSQPVPLKDPKSNALITRPMTIHGHEIECGIAIPLPESVPAPAPTPAPAAAAAAAAATPTVAAPASAPAPATAAASPDASTETSSTSTAPTTAAAPAPALLPTVTTTSKVVYQLGTSADAEQEGSSSSKKKKSKDSSASAAGPSKYDIFECVVGLLDIITDSSQTTPADIDNAAAVAAVAIAEEEAESQAVAAVASAALSASAPAAAAPSSTAAHDQDSKEEEGTEIEVERERPAASSDSAAAATPSAVSSASSAPSVATTLTFKVVGDGRTLWTSPAIALPSSGLQGSSYASFARIPAHHCLVNIAGVNKLELEVTAVTPVPPSTSAASSGSGGSDKKEAMVTLPANCVPVWADARVRVAPWVADRLAFEKEMSASSSALSLSQQQQGGSQSQSLEDEQQQEGTASDLKAYPILKVLRKQAARAKRIPLLSAYPGSAATTSGSSNKFALETCSPYFRYTHQLLQSVGDGSMDGPTAAAAILRLLRLFAREAYKPVRLSTPVPKFGEDAKVLLEVPFVVQADGKVFRSLSGIMKTLVQRLRASSSSSSSAAAKAAAEESLASILLITKGNLRRIVAAKVLPADLGIHLPHPSATATGTSAATGVSEEKKGHHHHKSKGAGGGASPAVTVASATSATSPATSGAAGDDSAANTEKERKQGTLGPLLDCLNDLISSHSAAATTASTAVPAELSAEAANVLDTGLPLFFPSPALQNAFLSDLLGKGEGGVLEVQFSWPTLLSSSDAASSAALQALSAKAKAAAAAASGAGEGGSSSKSADKESKEKDEVSGPAVAALERLVAGSSASSAAASAATGKDGGAAAAQPLSDPRFERAILLLQSYATRRGLPHTTVGHYGRFIHLVISLPDTQDSPIVRTLSTDLAQVFETAGLAGWSFPTGLHSPDISFKIERFLEFNRRERLATDPGVGWVRLYPRKTAAAALLTPTSGAAGGAAQNPHTPTSQDLDGVLGQVRAFLDAYVQEEKEAKEAAAKEKEKEKEGGAAAGAATAEKKETAAKPSAVVLDVFGDPITNGEYRYSSTPSRVALVLFLSPHRHSFRSFLFLFLARCRGRYRGAPRGGGRGPP
jgi:hypothetical protein